MVLSDASSLNIPAEVSLAYVALASLHKEVARASLYNAASSVLYSGSLDGTLYALQIKDNIAEALKNPIEVTSVSGVSALCLVSSGIAVCTMDGIVFRYGDDGSVNLIQPQQNCRISAISYSEATDVLVFADWCARLHIIENVSSASKKKTTVSIPQFTFTDNTQKENSCLSVAIQDSYLIAGFASGEIRMYNICELAASADFNSALITIQAHKRPVRSIELVSPNVFKQFTPKALMKRFPDHILPVFFSSGNDGAVFLHYPETQWHYNFHKISSVQLTDQYLFKVKLLQLGTADKPVVYLAVGGCDLQVYVYDCTALIATAVTGKASSTATNIPKGPINSLVCVTFLAPADVWDISAIPDPLSVNQAYLSFSLETGELMILHLVSGALSEQQKVATAEFLAEKFGSSTFVSPSRITGFHNSYVPLESVHCKDPSSLPQPLTTQDTDRTLVGHITVVLQDSKPAVYTYFNREWHFCGFIKQDLQAMDSKKKDTVGREWDIALPIQNDQTGGSYTLYMNVNENPWTVVDRFILETNIIETDGNDINYYKKQIYDFIIEQIPKTEVSPCFQVAWRDCTDYSLKFDNMTDFTTCIISASVGDAVSRPFPKAITLDLLQKCVAIISASVDDDMQYSLFLSCLAAGASTHGSDTTVMKTMSAKFTTELRAAAKGETASKPNSYKVLGSYLVALSYLLLNDTSYQLAESIYKTATLLTSGTALSSIYMQLATGALVEKTVGVFFFRFICALLYFESANRSILVWFNKLVDSSHASSLTPFIVEEDLDYLDYVSGESEPDGQNVAALVAGIRCFTGK